MKLTRLFVAAAMTVLAASSYAGPRGNCDSRHCPPPPAPPVPPLPPMAALSPVPPMPPMPPMAPDVDVPDEAHAACAGKAVGSRITYAPSRHASMTGVCKRDDEGMYFALRSYRAKR